MMWPRRPTTCTRSSPWANSKTGVPSTYDRFDFPPLRIVAIRIEALNFSVTMSRRTERLARKGLYLTVCRWMFRTMIPRARVSSSARARHASRARRLGKRTSDCFRRVSRIRCVHDGRYHGHAGDPVPCQDAGVLAASEFRIVVREKRDAKPVREFPQTSARGDRFLRGVGPFVAELNDRDAALEGRGDRRQQASDRPLR